LAKTSSFGQNQITNNSRQRQGNGLIGTRHTTLNKTDN
jgi:hypothetical protein